MRLTARWIFPVACPPIPNGILAIEGTRIQVIEAASTGGVDLDLGNAGIVPGFVNAHTHLDLSGLRGQCPPCPDFTGWLRAVIRHRRGQTAEQISADIHAGMAESVAAGTTLLGDISGQGASWACLQSAPLRSVVFLELLGLTAARAEEVGQAAEAWLQAHPETDRCRPGLSPHAPYSVHRALFARAASLHAPLAVHLAESQAELELLASQSGPFLPFLKDLGVWEPAGLVRSVAELLAILGPSLYVHGNYLPADAELPPGSTLVYCPRTHHAFGHPPHPFRHFLERGINVALGTDSLASNPDLSILEEARFLHRQHPDLPGRELLRMATLNGAQALGWSGETGSLEPGKSADLAIVPLPDEEPPDPHLLLFSSVLPVEHSMFGGGWRAGVPCKR